jgi:hypothetical protein
MEDTKNDIILWENLLENALLEDQEGDRRIPLKCALG